MPKKNKTQIPNYNFSTDLISLQETTTNYINTSNITEGYFGNNAIFGGLFFYQNNLGSVIQSIDGQPITLLGDVVIDGKTATTDTIDVINSNGTVSNPAITFSDDLTSGIYLNSSNQTLGLISNGFESITISNSKTKLNTQLQLVDGTINNPSIRFSDTDSGIYNYQNDIYVCHDGVNKLKVDNDISTFTTSLIIGNGTSASNVGLGFGSTLTGFQYDHKNNDDLKYINLAIDGQEFYKFGRTEFIPSTKDGITLGSSSSRFNGVYSKNYYTTSDANDKKNVTNLTSIIDQTSGFMRALRPVLYNYNDVITNVEIPDKTQEPINSNLINLAIDNGLIPPEPVYPTKIETITVVDEVLHLGLIAQEVSCLLTEYGFDAYHISPVSYDEPSNSWSFNYQDLNIMNLASIQLLIGNLTTMSNNVRTTSTTMASQMSTLGSAITNLSTTVGGLGASVSNINTRLINLSYTVGNLVSNVMAMGTNMNSITSNIINLNTEYSQLIGNVNILNTEYSDVIGNINSLSDRVSNLEV